MPRQDYADITIILDRSGSMASIWSDTVGGLAKLVDEQKAVPGDCTLTLTVFDTVVDTPLSATPIRDVPAMVGVLKDFGPRGMTSLLDAIGRGVVATGERLSNMAEADRPGKVLFVISTDGGENSSVEYKRSQVAEMIKHQQDAYSWEFLFLGANQDAIATAQSFSIPAANAMTYAANAAGSKAYLTSTSASVTRSRMGGSAAYTDQDRKAQVEAGVKA